MAIRGRSGVEEEEEAQLLGSSNAEKASGLSTAPIEDKVTWKNLPHKRQLLLLALCRLSTPLSNACLLPYLYYLAKSILSDPEHPSAPQKISRMTGLLVAAYPIGQMSTSMLWGRLSDTYGRKPTILLGLTISVIANLSFGFTRTIGMLLFWRLLAGMANGILGVMRTMTAEIVKDRKHRVRAFLAPPVIFNSGRVAALAIGGCLADPVHNLPALFGPAGVFNVSHNSDGVAWALKYPYALPALFNGSVLAVCLLLATLWLKESLAEKQAHRDLGIVLGKYISSFLKKLMFRREETAYTPIQVEEANMATVETPASRASVFDLSSHKIDTTKSRRPSFCAIWTPDLGKTLITFGLQPLHNSTFLHVFPVFLSMPIVASQNPTIFHFTGGLGLASPTIGACLATFGILGILLQLFIYPKIQKRIGTLGVLRLANSIFPLAYVFAPYLSLLAESPKGKWPAMAAVLFSQVMARTMAIPTTVLLLTEAALGKKVLGTVHGAGNTVSAMASAIGPVIGGLLLAFGIDHDTVGLVWWSWLCTVALVALGWSFVLRRDYREDDGNGPLESDS